MALSTNDFGKAVVAAGLMPADVLKSLWDALPADARPKCADAFAKLLIKQGTLNEFQSQELLSGSGTPLLLGDYVLLSKIGAGGMGQVFKAQHRHMDRLAAIKLLPAALTKDEATVKRFQREVKAAAKLSHSNIVQTFDASVQRGVWYLVMEYVEGKDLSALVKSNGPLPVDDAIEYVRQAACGLAFAHAEGVIHRDIKPANLLLDKKGVVKILDMGLARFDDGAGAIAAAAAEGLTQSGQVMGTLDYMAPEQAYDTRHADARADIYSLGCSLYRLLIGENLYQGETLVQKLLAHREKPIPSLCEKRKEIPPAIDAIFRRMVAKTPEERFQSMTEVVKALEATQSRANESTSSGPTVDADSKLTSFLQNMSQAGTRGPATTKSIAPARSSTNAGLEQTATFAGPDLATDPQSEVVVPPAAPLAASLATSAASPKPVHKTPKRTPLIAAAAFGAILLLCGVIVIIRDHMGKEVGRIELPPGLTAEVKTGNETEPKKNESTKTVNNGGAIVSTGSESQPSPYEVLTSPDWEWTEPENLGPDVNGSSSEKDATLSGDGLTLIFVSFSGGAKGDLKIATRSNVSEPFGKAASLGLSINNEFKHERPVISPDGVTLIFRSNRPGGEGGDDLWQAVRQSTRDSFSEPKPLGKPVNTPANDSPVAMGADGLSLLFWQPGKCFTARRDSRDKPFSELVPFELPRPPIPGNVAGMTLSSDQRVLIFGYYHGTPAKLELGIATRSAPNTTFGASVELGQFFDAKAINDSPALSTDGTILVFQSERPGGLGGLDLWMSRRVRKASTSAAPALAKAPFDAKQANVHQAAWAKHLGVQVETTNSIGAKMILIPPGEFLMGTTDEQCEADVIAAGGPKPDENRNRIRKTEQPSHRVVISKSFLIGSTEVTIGQFRQFVDAAQYVTEAEQYGFGDSSAKVNDGKIKDSQKQKSWRAPGHAVTDDSPVVQVTWNDAIAYCKWLSQKENTTYRLPTEAEWEYACRAGTTTQYSFGDDVAQLEQYGWYNVNSTGKAHPVAKKLPNAFGLYDMHGNLNEWCHDFYDERFYGKSLPVDPIGPSAGVHRVVRGGYWNYVSFYCRSAFRADHDPSNRSDYDGFRMVRVLDTLPPPAANADPVDLLPKVDIANDTIEGEWKKDGTALVTPRRAARGKIRLFTPVPMPDEYDIDILAEKESPDLGFAFGFVMQGRQATVNFDSDTIPGCYIETIDGKTRMDNSTYRPGVRFSRNKKIAVHLEFRRDSVSVSIDGEQIIHWRGKPEQLSPSNYWAIPDRGKLFLGSTGTYRIHALTLTPIVSTKPITNINDPAFQKWMKDVAAMPADEQVEAVIKKLVELNPGFDGNATGADGKDTPGIENGVVTAFRFMADDVTDISPVRALVGLKFLGCSGSREKESKLFDLSPLHGMKLTYLYCFYTNVSDLSPLQGMPLRTLICHNTEVSELSPVKRMSLTKLSCSSTKVSDLTPLNDCVDLTQLDLIGTKVTSAGVAALQKALPNCKIQWDGGTSASPTGAGAKPISPAK